MNFEELQRIWDTQDDRPMYAFDEAALHRVVKNRGRDISRVVVLFETMMVLLALTMAVALGSEPVLEGHDYHQFIDTAIWLAVSGYLLHGRRLRRRADLGFEESFRGDLDRAIAQADFQVKRLRAFGWWFMLPLLVGTGVNAITLIGARPKPWWIWPLLAASLGVTWWSMRHNLKRHVLPMKDELQQLREKLLDDGG